MMPKSWKPNCVPKILYGCWKRKYCNYFQNFIDDAAKNSFY